MIDPAVSQIERAIEALGRVGSDRVSRRMSDLELHGHDESWHLPHLPDAVFFPETKDEAKAGVQICADNSVPIVPFGAGTSLEGHIIPEHGGVTFDMSRMSRVLSVHAEDFYCVVEPGVTRELLNTELRSTGVFFPVDPGANASIGGMASTRASGTNAVRYGTMRNAVMGLEVVLANGESIRTGARTAKSAAGLDLTALFVGAEGTLGLITELVIRLHPIPEAISTIVAAFPDLSSAVSAVTTIMQSGLAVGRIELLDEVYAEALVRFEGLEIRVAPQLFIEFSGSQHAVERDGELAVEILEEFGALTIAKTENPEERMRLWRARHRAYWAGLKLRPGSRGFITDVCVPMSSLVEAIVATRRDFAAEGLMAPILGHVGDGNFHCTILVDPQNTAEVTACEKVHEKIVSRALIAGGTCTGEHGIGIGKKSFLAAEHGRAVETMRAIKKALDPQGVFNPGKML